MYRKNVSGQFVCFQMLLTATGAAATGLSPAVRRCIDGTFAAGGGTVTEDSAGFYKYAMAQADTNGNNIAFCFSVATAVPVYVNLVTTAADPTDSVRFGLAGLANAVPGAAGGLFIAGTNAATTITTSLTTTFTGNLTGSVASVTGAVGSVTGNVGGNVTGSVGSVVGAVGSVTGSVASVTGAVGSVTGNVGGNVTGSVGSVVGLVASNLDATVSSRSTYSGGAVASVTGSVASVTGNVGGNVTGSVGSVIGLTVSNLDATVSSRMAAGSYTAPDNTSITSIKTQTDKLAFTVPNQVDVNIQYVNDVLITGTGASGDEWGP